MIELYCFKKGEKIDGELEEKLGISLIFKDDKGKPYLPNRHVSITHSKDYIIYGFADENLGIDLQFHTDARWPQIAKRFFNKEESLYLSKYTKETGKEEFFRIWTAKESYVKYTGQGISDNFEKFSVLSNDLGVTFSYVDFDKAYTLCVCSEKDKEIVLNYRLGCEVYEND